MMRFYIYVKKMTIDCFNGSENKVLERFIEAANKI